MIKLERWGQIEHEKIGDKWAVYMDQLPDGLPESDLEGNVVIIAEMPWDDRVATARWYGHGTIVRGSPAERFLILKSADVRSFDLGENW